jgi:hypothetical protein
MQRFSVFKRFSRVGWVDAVSTQHLLKLSLTANDESLTRRLFESWISPPTASYFSLRKPSLVFALGPADGCSNLLQANLSLSTEVDERDSCPFANMRHPCRIPHGLLTRHIPVPRPAGATHANRLSCRFVPPKASVLGATYGIESVPPVGFLRSN